VRGPFIDEESARGAIREKVIDLARRRGNDVTNLKDSEVLPETAVLDSASILELIVWYEMTFDISIQQADLTLENFGTVDAMTRFLIRTT
jgi:acyl carrier protein